MTLYDQIGVGYDTTRRVDPFEVERGCVRLSTDMASGRFEDLLSASEHADGGYLFLVASRP